MKPSTLQTIFGCTAALALGVGVGLWGSSPGAGQPRSVDAAKPSTPTAPQPRNASAALAEAVRKAPGEQRWLLLAAASENATLQDMPGLIRLAGEDGTAVRMIAARWAELDPKHMFATLHGDYLLPDGSTAALPGRWEMTNVLIEQWGKSDPAGLVKAFTEVPDFSGLEHLRMSAANQLAKGDVELALRAMKDWNVRNYIPEMKKVSEWAARDPRRAAEVVAQLGREHVGREAMKEVGKAWAQSDPEAGLQFAAGLPPESSAALADEIVRKWAGQNLDAAVQFATKQEDPVFRAALAQGLVSEWAKTDAPGALAWSQENLRGQARNEAIASLIKTAAEKDIVAAGELAAGMNPGPAQNRACASLFETWFKKGPDQREAALTWLEGLPDETARRNALERVQWDWAWREPEAVRDFITGPHGKLASTSIVHQVSRNLTSKNPEAAMEWAKKLPAGQMETARSAVLETWLDVRPEGAAIYARNLPEGPERNTAIQRVSQSLAYQSPKQAGDWYRSLTGDSQKLAREAFAGIGLTADKRKELDQALEGN